MGSGLQTPGLVSRLNAGLPVLILKINVCIKAPQSGITCLFLKY
jgi:hypothetical protein